MKNKVHEIYWTDDAQKDYLEITEYYKAKSQQAFHLVNNAIITNIEKAALNPFIFEVDKFKKIKDENFRAFTIFHTRITYQLKENKLYVLRLRHTSREPKLY
jgi:plasmid stabilization system protein ParE